VIAGRLCPLCGSARVSYAFGVASRLLYHCAGCNLLFRGELVSPDSGVLALTELGFLDGVYMPRALSAEDKLDHLAAHGLLAPGTRVVAVRCEDARFLARLAAAGVEVAGLESNVAPAVRALDSKDLEREAGSFDACVIFDSLGLHVDPVACLAQMWKLLKADGVLVLSLPSLESMPAQLFRRAWVEFQKPYLYYFDPVNVQNVLFRAGFDRISRPPYRRVVTAPVLVDYLREFPSRRVRALCALARPFLRGRLRRMPLTVPGSHIVLVARKAATRRRRKLSVVVPVYNERRTFPVLMSQLLAKEIPDLDREVIVVESGSTDGTRDEVEKYRAHPGVVVIDQAQPRGKGNAVREGFGRATGDFIIIQDADLEYDLDDYDTLLAPLLVGSHAFVLGSRHVGGQNVWKLRQFNDMPFTAWFFNVGHTLFLTLFNVLYRQSLSDPFTMFKVFRRDCLHGLTFECDRFDFDFELVIKLIRKGYRPLEIPVNYRSRSFAEGKKVRVFRDPLTWMRALVKYRLARVER